MTIEKNNFGFTKRELKNNNLNPELNEFLKDNELSKEEVNVLIDMFNENKGNVLLISKRNLRKLRKILHLSSRRNYITTRDKKAIAAYVPRKYIERKASFKEKVGDLFKKHIDKNGYLRNVKRLRLDQLISPYQKTKFSIKLSDNSIYSSKLDGKTFNVVWGKDKRTGKYTYVFENGPLKRRRVLILNGDRLLPYLGKESIYKKNVKEKRNYKSKKERQKKINHKEYKNISERNRSFIDGLKLPSNYKKIALKFASKLRSNEILTKKTPIALVDANRKEMLYTINGRKIIVPILIGKNGITYGGYVPGDRKTLAGKIHRFEPSLSKKASSLDGDASNSGHSKTVKSASLQSELSMASGGRYFHGVDGYRIKGRFRGMGTWGCVGVDKGAIRKMYYDVKKRGIGYGYVG